MGRMSPLAALCLIAVFQAPARGADAVYNILDYGAHGDGSAPSTDAIGRPSRPQNPQEAAPW